jgi:hypothetical protein
VTTDLHAAWSSFAWGVAGFPGVRGYAIPLGLDTDEVRHVSIANNTEFVLFPFAVFSKPKQLFGLYKTWDKTLHYTFIM